MEKLKMHSPNQTDANIARIRELFPNCVTETKDEKGAIRYVVDFDQLRQELSGNIVEGPLERYRLDWPGKREALVGASVPTSNTLRPLRNESLGFDTADNLFIEGDNLEALKLLQETYLGRVKMIYIDPPYNTGNDFLYEDDFSESEESHSIRSGSVDEVGNRLVSNTEANGRFHSDWLSMIYPRLRLARNLLSEDGAIFVSIDDNEVSNLRAVCDEIFGSKNFVATVIWQRVYSPKNSARFFSVDHDYIVVYAKNSDTWKPTLLPRTEEANARYTNVDFDARGPWKPSDLTARNSYSEGLYEVVGPTGRKFSPGRGRYWRQSKKKFDEMNANNEIWWGPEGDAFPAQKRFLSDVKQGMVPQTLWKYELVGHTQEAKQELLKYVDFQKTENVLNSVKPSRLIKHILRIGTSSTSNDIVMDFFAGSGPTAQAVLELNGEDGGNRRFVLVQIAEPLPEPEGHLNTISDLAKARIRTVAAKLESSQSLDLDRAAKGKTGFRVLKIDSSNMADVYYRPGATEQGDLLGQVDSVKPGRDNAEDLLFQVLVDWGVDLSLPIQKQVVQGKAVYFVNAEPFDLIACFDSGVSEGLVKELAKHKPVRIVFRDNGFESDAVKINVEQIFRQLSPSTDVKVI